MGSLLVDLRPNEQIGGGGGGAVDSVNGRTGAVILTKSDVGLPNVDNTADVDKPVKPSVIRSASSGLISGGVVTINATTSKFDISAGTGQIIDDWTTPLTPTIIDVSWSAFTAVTTTYLATQDDSFVGIDSTGAVVQYNATFTPEQRRDIIPLAKLAHTSRTAIANIVNAASVAAAPLEQLYDLISFCKIINSGMGVSANGANLKLNRSAGSLFAKGINYSNSLKNPHIVSFTAGTAITFQYRTQTGVATANTTDIVPGSYDLAGTVTAIAGSSNQATNQRVYMLPNGNIRIQYGQNVYSTLAAAVAGIPTGAFVQFQNLTDSAILIGILSVTKGCTALNNTSTAIFTPVSKFGEYVGGSGGTSTTTLQQAYDNSTNPEILTDATRDGLSIKRGSAADTDTVLEVLNGAGTQTFKVTGEGKAYEGANQLENVGNKSTTTTLGTSNTLYPTQNAVKTYADTKRTTEPAKEAFFIDDFDSSQALQSLTAAGGLLTIINTSEKNQVGHMRQRVAATVNSISALFGSINDVNFGTGSYYFEAILKVIDLYSVGVKQSVYAIGYGDSNSSAEYIDGAYFEYDGATSANWRICTSSGGTRTKTTTSVAVSASTYVKLSLLVNTAGTSVEYFIDGTSVGTITTNIPTAPTGYHMMLRNPAGVGISDVYVDYYLSRIIWNNTTRV